MSLIRSVLNQDGPELLDLLQLDPIRDRGHPLRPPGPLQRKDLLGHQGEPIFTGSMFYSG